MAGSVSIDYVTDGDRLSDYGNGALQILIDDVRLNRYVNEEDLDDDDNIYWKEYAGDYLFGDLRSIIETTAAIIRNKALYEKHKVQFEGYESYLVLEYLGQDQIRVAYRINSNREEDDSFKFRANPQSACGYRVELEEWVNAVQNAVENFQEELRENGEKESADWFKSELEALQSY